MRIIRDLNEISDEFSKGTAVTLGNFDGIHLAHQALMKKVIQSSILKNISSVVISYFPNPALVLGKNPNFKNIITQKEKETLIEISGMNFMVVMPFTQELADTSAEDFLENILIRKLNVKKIIIGFNHCFGKNREGDFEFLQKHSLRYGYEVEKFEPVFFGEEKISSSLVRASILQGDMEKASLLLGRGFDVEGKVIHGFQRGKSIGFPTANIDIPEEIILPPVGVYATHAVVGGKTFASMTNVGDNPTFENKGLGIETNIFDFSGDLYGENLKVIFEKRIRDEKKFPSVEHLIRQLRNDEEVCRKILVNRIFFE